MRSIPRFPEQLPVENVENMHFVPRHLLLNDRGSGHSEPGPGLWPLSSYLSTLLFLLSLVPCMPLLLFSCI